MGIDPVTLAVIQNGLQQVCNEMDTTFVGAAFSPVIAEGFDRSDGIYHRETSELIAQGELGLPIFVGTMQFSTRAVINRAKILEDGDIFIVNDPYSRRHSLDGCQVSLNHSSIVESCSRGRRTRDIGRILVGWCRVVFRRR